MAGQQRRYDMTHYLISDAECQSGGPLGFVVTSASTSSAGNCGCWWRCRQRPSITQRRPARQRALDWSSAVTDRAAATTSMCPSDWQPNAAAAATVSASSSSSSVGDWRPRVCRVLTDWPTRANYSRRDVPCLIYWYFDPLTFTIPVKWYTVSTLFGMSETKYSD